MVYIPRDCDREGLSNCDLLAKNFDLSALQLNLQITFMLGKLGTLAFDFYMQSPLNETGLEYINFTVTKKMWYIIIEKKILGNEGDTFWKNKNK